MGVVPQLDNLDVDVTVEDNLAVFARLYRVPDVGEAVDRGLELARLTTRRQRRGRQALRRACAAGCCSRAASSTSPRLLLLDEPTVGLDPQIRTELWSLIDGLRTEGTTILMSTHYIEEAERLADEVAVMADGKIIARGSPAELIAEHAGRETAEVYGPPSGWPRCARRPRPRACACARPARRSRSSAPSAPRRRGARGARSAAPRRSRTSSCC